MKNHVIICGYGRVGKGAVEDLILNKIPFVIIDNDISLEAQFGDKDVVFIQGNAAIEETLIQAGIKEAQALITCLPKDPDNLYVVLSARQLKSDICIISRASRHDAVSKLKFAGATNVIMPDTVGGNHMASLFTNPDLMEFMDVIRYETNQGVNIKSILANDLAPIFVGKHLKDIDREKIFNCQVIGLKKVNGDYVVNPKDDLLIEVDTRLFLLGDQSQVRNLENLLSK